MSTLKMALVGGLAMVLAGCHPTPRDKMRRWLLCEECTSGELAAVVQLGDRVTDDLGKALKGPPESSRENIRRQAKERFARLASPPVTEAEFLAHYDSSFVATYQSHAATALGRIGTPRARALLLEAVQQDTLYREDVRRALATAAPAAPAATAGALQAAPRDSFVRVDPTIVVHDSTTGKPLPGVRVVFRVDSGGGQVTDTVARTDTSGVASTRWALGPAPDSVNVLRATVLNRSVRFHATGHGLRSRLVFVVQPSNGKRGQPMSPPARVAALDAWDQRDTTINGVMFVDLPGTAIALTRLMVAGQADFAGYVPLFSGSGLRFRGRMINTTSAVSQPFDVAP